MARDLSVLIELKSYQDMTDEEIDMVMQWKAEQAAINAIACEQMRIARDESIARLEQSKANAEAAQARFDALIGRGNNG